MTIVDFFKKVYLILNFSKFNYLDKYIVEKFCKITEQNSEISVNVL